MNSIKSNEISRYPKVIKDAQSDAVTLDILVCGRCHSAFHFIEDFQCHKDQECSGESPLQENFVNESKAQVWGFLLWKNSRQRQETNKNSWAMYQMWCKLEEHVREGWITAGKNLQFFSSIGTGKMQEFKYGKNGDHDNYDNNSRAAARKDSNITVLNTQNNSDLLVSDMETDEDYERVYTFADKKSIGKSNETLLIQIADESQKLLSNKKSTPFAKRTRKNTGVLEERNVEKILGKTWNQKKKRFEYLIKWEGLSGENNTWEPIENLDTCKELVNDFESVHLKKVIKSEIPIINNVLSIKDRKIQSQILEKKHDLSEERPQRSSKRKAMNMVKAWCGNISDKDDGEGKKKHRDDDDDYKSSSNFESNSKKLKHEVFSDDDDDDDDDDGDSEWSGGEDIMSDEERRNCTYGSNKKLKPKTSILEATILSKSRMADLQPQQIVTQVVSSASTTLTNVSAGQLQQRTSLPHTVAKGNIQSGIYATPKKLPKINPPKNREQVRIIQRGSKIRSGIFKEKAMASTCPPLVTRMLINDYISSSLAPKAATVNGLQSSNRYLVGSSMFKPKSPVHLNNKVFTTTNLLKSTATRNATPMKLMPSGVMSLSSLKQQSALPTSSISLSNTNININTTTNANNSMFINQDGEKFILENGLQLSKQDIKDYQNETSLESFTDESGNLMLKDEDGTIYQVAGQDENGQTILLAQGSSGEQQCLLLSEDENSKIVEKVAGSGANQTKKTQQQQLHIETESGEEQLLLKAAVDGEEQDPSLVAHVLKADPPSPGGTRKITLLLPDGNYMIADVNKEQYDTLGLDK